MVFMCLHFKECASLKDNISEALPWCILSSLGKLCWCKCSWLLHHRWTLLFLDKTCPSFCCIIINSSNFFSNSSTEKLITWTNCRLPNDPFLSISLSVSETEEDMHPIPNIEGVMGGGPLIKTAVKSVLVQAIHYSCWRMVMVVVLDFPQFLSLSTQVPIPNPFCDHSFLVWISCYM